VGWLLGPLHQFLTVGFLPPEFRVVLGLPWNARRQAAFRAVTQTGGRVSRLLPLGIREFPINLYLWDSRRRISQGRPIV
jgi:uncharacterized protein (DUF2236 family)